MIRPLSLHIDADPPPGAEGPTLVLLHGFTQAGTAWAEVRAALRTRLPGVRTVTVDLPGHGRSPAPDDPAAYGWEATVMALEAALDTLGVGAAWWCGYSLGGRLALHVAVQRPARVAGLALVSATAGLADARERAARVAQDAALAERIRREGVPAFLDHWLALPLFAGLRRLPPERYAALRTERAAGSAAGLAHSLGGVGTGTMAPLWERLGEVRVPALVLAGAEDAKFVALARRLAAGLPQAELTLVPEAGHSLPQERPAAVAEALAAWLEAHAT